MSTSENTTRDEGLIGNEKMERGHRGFGSRNRVRNCWRIALTVVRCGCGEKGQVILAVDMPQEQNATPATPCRSRR